MNVGSGATLVVRPSEGAAGLLLEATNVEVVRVRELRPWDVNFWLPAQQTLRAALAVRPETAYSPHQAPVYRFPSAE